MLQKETHTSTPALSRPPPVPLPAPVGGPAVIDFQIAAFVRIFVLQFRFGGFDYCHCFDQRREGYIGEDGSKPG